MISDVCNLSDKIGISLGLKKKLFDWRNPTDPIFTTDPKYFSFFVCKKKILKPRKTNIFI